MTGIIIAVAATLVIVFPSAFAIGGTYRKKQSLKDVESAENKARKILDEASQDAERVKKDALIEAKDEVIKQKEEADKEIKQRKLEVEKAEQRINQRQDLVDKRFALIEEKELGFSLKQQELEKKQKELDKAYEKEQEELVRISRLTVEDAKHELMVRLKDDMKTEMANYIVEAESKAKYEADKKSKELLVGAIQRCAADHTSEATISVVNLPSDDMKGRIIGREGRNIKSIEQLTGRYNNR